MQRRFLEFLLLIGLSFVIGFGGLFLAYYELVFLQYEKAFGVGVKTLEVGLKIIKLDRESSQAALNGKTQEAEALKAQADDLLLKRKALLVKYERILRQADSLDFLHIFSQKEVLE